MAYDYALWFDLGFVAACWDGEHAELPTTANALELAAFKHGFLYGSLPL